MHVIGITGSFGTGKSTVAKLFRSYRAKLIDADKIVHEIIGSDNCVSRKIIRIFGNGIVNSNSNKIDRASLGKKAFKNSKALSKLCRVIHPAVIGEIKRRLKAIKKTSKNCIVVIDAPLLIEAGLLNIVDKLVVVKTNRKNQIKRIRKKMNLKEGAILKRAKAQLPLSEKIKLADYIIDNNKTLSFTKTQVREIYKDILK